ncbi:MAG: hypothetical protein U0736_09890 [Gemmataceae bacterium]
MTEQEWLACTDPTPMLRLLVERHTSERKLRLLACACCRLIWDHLIDPRSRQAVEVAERFADDRATLRELAYARAHAMKAAGGAAWAAYWAANVKAAGPLWNAFAAAAAAPARQAVLRARGRQADTWEAAQASSAREQVALLRDVAGNPFRPADAEPAWRYHDGGIVVQLAEGIYEDRAFDRLPILADALEDAGCRAEALLAHCRADREHVRGCWAVDLILGYD